MLAMSSAPARTGLASLGAAVRGVVTVAVASIPLTVGTAPPSKLAAVARTREGDTLYRAVPVPSNVGAMSMTIPRGFLGSGPMGSPLLWS